jgi:diadenosine tetraphosphatase ApaH/serine/threonine PP2A family protein phosphatase
VDHACHSADAAARLVLEIRARGRAASVWHPKKVWAVMRSDDLWYPLTLCPELVTLRQVEALGDRLRAWTEMLQASIDVQRVHGLGLDLNPANFGREPLGGQRLYYIDDEFYDRLDERNVAGAIVARIPEEPSADCSTWRLWGLTLYESLKLGDLRWEAVHDEIQRYPLAERYDERRRSLLAAIVDARDPQSTTTHSRRELTCILADVHANLPALEAVLADARYHGASRYLFLGDAIGYGPHPRECVRRLAELPRAQFVRGNHDHAIATGRFEVGMNRLARECAWWTRAALGPDELSWLGGLPVEHVEEDWVAVHGAPKDPFRFLAYVYEMTYEDNLCHLRERRIPLCFCGHTHVQLTHVELVAGTSKLPGPRKLETSAGRHWLINPGSVGQPRDADPRAAYALWDRRSGEVTTLRVPYDVQQTIDALRGAGLPAQLEQRLQAGV